MSALLEIVAVTGPAWVQGAARRGWRHHGVPPGGPLVPPLADAAARSVGNPDDLAHIEAFGPLTVRAHGGLLVATDGEVRALADGEEWRLPPPAPLSVRVVAVRGGIDVPVRLGGRGTLPGVGLGGFHGRALLSGDRLPVGPSETLPAPRIPPALGPSLVASLVPLAPGPDGPSPAFSALLSLRWRVAACSRVGVVLDGPPIPAVSGGEEGSDVAWPGLVQLPHGGAPVVLGPDAPTTGGYPVIAVVTPEGLARLTCRSPGTSVRFARSYGLD